MVPVGPKPEGDEDIVFHYNRERRLERAPESVRWLESRRGVRNGGFFKVLFATRASKLLFFTIVALVLAYNLGSLFTGTHSSGKLGEDRYAVKAFWFDGKVLVSIRRSGAVLEDARRGVLAVTAHDTSGTDPRGSASFPIGLAAEEDFRLSLDSPSGKPALVSVGLIYGGAVLSLEAKVE